MISADFNDKRNKVRKGITKVILFLLWFSTNLLNILNSHIVERYILVWEGYLTISIKIFLKPHIKPEKIEKNWNHATFAPQPQSNKIRNQTQKRIWEIIKMWKLNNILLNNWWINEEITKINRKYLEMNENDTKQIKQLKNYLEGNL